MQTTTQTPHSDLVQKFLASESIESAVALMDAVDIAKARLAEFSKQADEAIIDYIEREGAFSVGDRIFCIGKATSEKTTMPPTEAFDYALEKANGDLDSVKGLLSSNCFKAGAVEKILGTESRKKMFVKVVRTVLDEKEGTERIMKKLVRTERRFLPNVPVRGEIVEDIGDE